MRYTKLPMVMWLAFRGSFARAAERELGVLDGKGLMRVVHAAYKEILSGVPEFDRDSRFVTNILSCAMVVAVLKNLQTKPTVEAMTAFYKAAMCGNALMKVFVKKGKTYTTKGQEKLRRDAEASQKRTNPYDWKFTYEPGETLNQYTATFTTCGICKLMDEHGFHEYVSALCLLDYDMAAMNNTVFTRQYTLASGGPHCDCHYDHQAYR